MPSPAVKMWCEVGEMERIPRGYAVAWWRMNTCSAVCLPWGLHLIVGAVRSAYIWVRAMRVSTILEGAERRGWDRGFAAGRVAGASDERMRDGEELLARRQEIEHDAIHRFLVIVARNEPEDPPAC